MKLKHLVFVLAIIMMAGIALAQEASQPHILLYSPQDNETAETSGQDFVFSVEGPADALNCTLYIDEKQVKSFYNLPRRATRTLTTTLYTGDYLWKIGCAMEEGEFIESETRSLSVNADQAQESCVDKVSKGSGTYRFIFTHGCISQQPVTIAGVRPEDWLEYQIKQGGRTPFGRELKENYLIIYMVRFAQDNERDYLTYKTSKDQANKNLFKGESALIDADGDAEPDLNLFYESLNIKKATLSVRLIGADYVPVEESPENTTDTTPQDNTTGVPSQDEPATPPPEEPSTEPDTTPIDGTPPVVEQNDPTKFYVTIFLIIVLVIVVILLSVKKGKRAKVEEKRQTVRHAVKKAEQKKLGKPKEVNLAEETAVDTEEKPDFMLEGGEPESGKARRKR